MSNGILSQSIANMQQAEATIQSFSGLPQNAVNIQQNVGEVVAALLPQVQTMQQQVLAFAARLELQLTQQLANTGPFNPEALKAFVDLVQQEIAPIQTLTAQTLTASQTANDRITQDNIALQRIGVELQATIAGLQSNLDGARQELDSLNKKKLYLLGLGLLGLPGLIALAVTLTQTQNKVSSLEGQVNQIEGQIQRQQGFLGQTTAFSQQFGSLIDRVSKVGNTITLLGGDIANVARDAGQGDPELARLFFTAALTEVRTLQVDAS
ncbi:polyhydroxyalkanoate synthesis regulator phasin [Aeromonas hydrophila]|jgi:polyhydroxyalkanoate synthesis regulator phasin|uniref:Uncharacterized protein n=1 Tax=Aeromonas hydrophila TaxID=644 RepID=A0AAX3PE03_AERHY|nr:hypothetical protein [Aeromonas hydrophila]HDT5863486.1 hypothetical protein [Aeromonas hydrophila subsp. hydrophila]EHK5438863.1 hypothetical protein [Aeromonas hydrophila]EIS3742806.1 hypothetical protein [Aeromonas hydrophila]KHN60205.1 hypothetical protein OI72_04255 [Aeromonas hydrophila]MBW3844746.1 hypothetical protein [Aeromonas hydrophila]